MGGKVDGGFYGSFGRISVNECQFLWGVVHLGERQSGGNKHKRET